MGGLFKEGALPLACPSGVASFFRNIILFYLELRWK